jgi:hypothetical protein
MNVLYYQLLKIDNTGDSVSVENFANAQNINDYIMDLITICSGNAGDREYSFDPTLSTTKNHIISFIDNEDNREDVCNALAQKLLVVEKEAQQRIVHLNNEIPKGILLLAYAQMTESEYKVLITKADYTEFLEELSGEKKSGLPTKKKIFKSFILNISFDDMGNYSLGRIITYDANTSTKAVYWWKSFLELNELRDDKRNTLTAYQAIKNDILEPIRKKHKQDYLCLRNLTIAYFRSDGEFNLDHYKDSIIGSYNPFDANLDIGAIKAKITSLPQKHNFDNVFNKTPNEIKDKFKDVITLTPEIDLKIKQDILHIDRVIRPKEDEEGNKYIMIRSEDGFKYAEGLSNRNGNE